LKINEYFVIEKGSEQRKVKAKREIEKIFR